MELKDTKNMSLEEKKAYLQELKLERQRIASGEQLRRQSSGFQAAAEAMMPYDPTGAFNLMDKKAKTDIDREEMLRKGQYDPDQVRFKLVSRMNSITGQLRGMPANDPMYATLSAELTKLQSELDLPNPSIQHVYASDNKIVTPTSTTVPTYESIINSINGATKDTFESVKAKVATDKGSASLSTEQSSYIDALIEQKRKELFPKVVNVNSKIDELFKSSGPVKDAYTRYDKALNAYNSAKSAYGANAIGASIGNFLYSLRPEAVNEGDVELAKNSVRDGNQQAMKTLLDKVGLGNLLTTDYKALATQLGKAAYDKLVSDRNEDIIRIIELNSQLDKTSVEKRASTYYKSPSSLSSKNTTDGLRTGKQTGTSNTTKSGSKWEVVD